MLLYISYVIFQGLFFSQTAESKRFNLSTLDEASSYATFLKSSVTGQLSRHGLDSPDLKRLSIVATDAFLWSFPLVNTAPNFKNSIASISQMNQIQWNHVPNNASFNTIVSPNVNVLYGPRFLDLTSGSVQISVPNTSGRYYVLQCMDFWGFTFARIGFTVTGTEAGTFTLVGPSENATSNSNTIFVVNTNGVWIMGRIAVINQNETDISIANELLSDFKVTWLGRNDEAAVKHQQSYWDAYTSMVQYNAPLPSMEEDLELFKPLGITASGVDWSSLHTSQKLSLSIGATAAWELLQESTTITQHLNKSNTSSLLTTWNEWTTSPVIGSTNTSIPITAVVSYSYVAANIPAEAVYWTKFKDNCGNALTLSGYYVFNVSSRPPYNSFWSLTTYNASNFFLINTTDNVYTLGSQFPGVVSDGGEGGDEVAGTSVLYLSQQQPSTDLTVGGTWMPLGDSADSADDVIYFLFRIYSPTNADVVYNYAPPNITVTDSKFNYKAC
ncbi:hypothetical protein CEUSTIGMA_g6561.t1 [Chlamydomonas eustigma]|uniref:Uncharacterized protein n=1 Tax=Chlamydomonas eustigma TaxID=1157962 RepID=A0A250X7Q3_9CHLO|nr:hypothetical protein CEUSTIGMA_g6561.t1 [Chlamydomonas eustigma]|eukprot:GAX79121.1 hypothetical protein CEUSTIGMA_g6561.t1 [Chlamydomonas eustigma]